MLSNVVHHAAWNVLQIWCPCSKCAPRHTLSQQLMVCRKEDHSAVTSIDSLEFSGVQHPLQVLSVLPGASFVSDCGCAVSRQVCCRRKLLIQLIQQQSEPNMKALMHLKSISEPNMTALMQLIQQQSEPDMKALMQGPGGDSTCQQSKRGLLPCQDAHCQPAVPVDSAAG